MTLIKHSLGLVCALLTTTVFAQSPGISPQSLDRMQAIMRGETRDMSDADKAAMDSAKKASTTIMEATTSAPQSTINAILKQTDDMLRQAKEAYVAALPPRDREIGRQVMLGSGPSSGGQGRLYYFVSRSMPMALLRAYAEDALQTGATLVVKGLRKGDTIKEYLTEAMADFNTADGQILGALEINPNLFDMFGVSVVPTVVWTNRVDLDDIGSGCEDLPAGQGKKLMLPGPNDNLLEVDAPECAPAPEGSYYKIAGALATPYVLDRFEKAGAPKDALQFFRSQLAARARDVHDGNVRTQLGNAMTPITGEAASQLPQRILDHWESELRTKRVQRSPYGPIFLESDQEGEDDAAYRRELLEKIKRGKSRGNG